MPDSSPSTSLQQLGNPLRLPLYDAIVDISANASINVISSTTNHADAAPYHSKGEWEDHKTRIVQSYRKPGNTIFDVRDEMLLEHNFHASPRQYKYQLKRWKVKKNVSAASKEVEAKKADQCFQEGKPLPLKRSDGSSYEWQKTRRYDLDKNRRLDVWRLYGVPTGVKGTKQVDAFQSLLKLQRSSPAPMVRSLNDPDDFRFNDLLLKQVRAFVPISSIKSGLQDKMGDSDLYHYVRRLYIVLLNDKSPTYNIKAMMMGARIELKRHLQHPSVILLMEVIHMCRWRHWQRKGRLRPALEALLFYVEELTKHNAGAQQLFGSIIRAYRRADIWPTHVWYCLFKEMENFRGLPIHAHAFAVHQIAHFQFWDDKVETGHETIAYYTKSLVSAFGEYSHWPRKFKLLSAVEGYDKCGMYAEAKAAYEYASSTALEQPDEVTVRGFRGLLGLYSNPSAFYDPEMRIYYARKAFEASLSHHTAFDSATLWDLGDLKTILKEYNRDEELAMLEMEWQVEREKAKPQTPGSWI